MKYFNQLWEWVTSLFRVRVMPSVEVSGAGIPSVQYKLIKRPPRAIQGIGHIARMRKSRRKLFNASRKHSRGKK